MGTEYILNISEDKLLHYVQLSKNDRRLKLGKWKWARLDWKATNYVTGGLYRVEGKALSYNKWINWSLIIKVILPSINAATPSHFNFWKREILAYQSGLLTTLPPMVRAPRFYGIETKEDHSIWIWLEEVIDEVEGKWQLEHFKQVARLLGNFNGSYLVHKELPSEDWLARRWLLSWAEENDKYDHLVSHIPDYGENVEYIFSTELLNRYHHFRQMRYKLFDGLHSLPKVLTHNDAWLANMFLQKDGTLVLIDWTFVGIAGVGEELGRFYGLLLNTFKDPFSDLDQLADEFFEQYYEGLVEAGWKGDKRLAYFGFKASVGIRSGLIVPKLFKDFAHYKDDKNKVAHLQHRLNVASHLLSLSEEAHLLYSEMNSLAF